MYFKLALRNVRKSYKDFMIYFLTLAFSVCLFYTFNSFQDQQAVMELSTSQSDVIELLIGIMVYLSIFVAVVLAFLILYANNFLIKRRKKELGLYMLMGMPKNKISRVLIFETFIIGIISLLMGILAGLFLSQILTSVTANLFEVTLNYHFVFSKDATILTVISFGIIFFIIMLFNTFVLNRYKLIDLLHADQTIENLRIKRVIFSVVLFVISITCLGIAYYISISKGFEAFNNLYIIIPLGCIGTFLFFMSLAGFLLTVVKANKRIYLKNLNCFVMKQINANINTNCISMSIVCIMLLMSIGALATGMNLNNTINRGIRESAPFDYSLSIQRLYPNGSINIDKSITFKDLQAISKVNPSDIQSENITSTYLVKDLKIDDKEILQHIEGNDMQNFFKMNVNAPILAIKQTDYNRVMKAQGSPLLDLKDKETYMYSTTASIEPAIQNLLDKHITIKPFNSELKVVNNSYTSQSMFTTDKINADVMFLVMQDKEIPKNASVYYESWNLTYKNGVDADKTSNAITNQLDAAKKGNHQLDNYGINWISKTGVQVSSKGISVVFTYIGLYLGIVFLIASAVILALQQLSQANDNKKHYLILSKIGAEEKMLNRSIFLQIGIYFLMPLLLAIIHSVVGIQVVNTLVVMFGKTDIFNASIITGGIIIFIYGAYFMLTYFGYKRTLKS